MIALLRYLLAVGALCWALPPLDAAFTCVGQQASSATQLAARCPNRPYLDLWNLRNDLRLWLPSGAGVGAEALPLGAAAPVAIAAGGNFLYTIDPITGCVASAIGLAVRTASAGGLNGDNFQLYCDTALQGVNLAGVVYPYCGQTPVGEIQRGHIIAQSLGGTNLDILNLFPQVEQSNERGRWKNAERAIQFSLEPPGSAIALACANQITIRVKFRPCNAGNNEYTQQGGIYQFEVASANCWMEMANSAVGSVVAAVQHARRRPLAGAAAPNPANPLASTLQAVHGLPIIFATYWDNSHLDDGSIDFTWPSAAEVTGAAPVGVFVPAQVRALLVLHPDSRSTAWLKAANPACWAAPGVLFSNTQYVRDILLTCFTFAVLNDLRDVPVFGTLQMEQFAFPAPGGPVGASTLPAAMVSQGTFLHAAFATIATNTINVVTISLFARNYKDMSTICPNEMKLPPGSENLREYFSGPGKAAGTLQHHHHPVHTMGLEEEVITCGLTTTNYAPAFFPHDVSIKSLVQLMVSNFRKANPTSTQDTAAAYAVAFGDVVLDPDLQWADYAFDMFSAAELLLKFGRPHVSSVDVFRNKACTTVRSMAQKLGCSGF